MILQDILDVISWFFKNLAKEIAGARAGVEVQPTSLKMRPTDYIPWEAREIWAYKVECFLSGDPIGKSSRDLQGLSTHPELIKEFGIDTALLRSDIYGMQEFESRSSTLANRIRTERHPFYSDRSIVRKIIASNTVAEGKVWNNHYSHHKQKMIDGGVVFGVSFDSIRGYIQWLKQ